MRNFLDVTSDSFQYTTRVLQKKHLNCWHRRMNEYKSAKGKPTFAISIVCVVFGALIRLAYCIRYPIQPRDAYSYSLFISQWEENGLIPDNMPFFPLSLWILKIPFHVFQYDCMKSGIIANIILGLLIIAIIVNIANCLFKDLYTILFVGFAAATHPALVTFSCSFLRENTYLFFSLLTIFYLVHYYKEHRFSDMFLASIFGAVAFLCRLEGLEVLVIVFFLLTTLVISKRMRLSKATWHGMLFLIVFFFATTTICLFFNCKNIIDIIMRGRFQSELRI